MQQCRICFEEGTDLLSPCGCRGTAAYIHPACLDQYIQYYPDRVCRVCNVPFDFFRTSREVVYLVGILGMVVILLWLSRVDFLVKLTLFSVATLFAAFFFHQQLLTPTTLTFLGILVFLFFPGGHVSAVYTWLAVLGLIAFCYTVVLCVPMSYILMIVVAMFVFAYMAMLTFAAYANLDTSAFSVYISILFLAWYGWIRSHPRLRLR